MNKKQKLIKEMFEMVYQWGRVGIVVDENCPAYKSVIKKLEKQILKGGEKNVLKNG